MMKLTPYQRYLGIALILSFVICLTIHFPLILAALFEDSMNHEGHRRQTFDLALVIHEVANTFVVTFLMFLLNYFIIRPFDKYRKIKFKRVFVSFFLTLFSVLLLIVLSIAMKHAMGIDPGQRKHDDELLFRNIFSSLLVLGSIYIIRLIYQKQTYELENEMLRSESLQSQFESLKNQVSPHFLFNSLTALKTLIIESPNNAGIYVDNLSKVLRYTLQSNEKQLVTLEEELESTQSYIFLIKMRYDKNLTIVEEIKKDFLNWRLPPLTLQTLLENAVKHNEISNRHPLTITIKTTDEGMMEVLNPIQEKLTGEEGTGIGLTNLSRQFQLLGVNEIQIIADEGLFRVVVPLINGKR